MITNKTITMQVNNSNGMKSGDVVNYNQSLMGLVYNKLDSNGDLQVINGVKAPYFDANTLLTEKYNGKKVASVYKSSFPFRTETDSNGVTKYFFSSKNAKDNIYFTWDGTNPKQINYGAGEYYGVHDNLKNFGGTAYSHLIPTAIQKLQAQAIGFLLHLPTEIFIFRQATANTPCGSLITVQTVIRLL